LNKRKWAIAVIVVETIILIVLAVVFFMF